jgi:2-polyprenyl-3-methyl-5-hydroxy-6-metoxy-1,4-benzoquinol methylase
MDVPTDWYDGFFETEWLDAIEPETLRTPDERTLAQVEFVIEKLGLAEGARVLDLACGHGRIALELARRGYRVTGLDLSSRSLQLARAAAAEQGLAIDWVEADMRNLPSGREFDAVVSVFTAFGYFADERENQRVLNAVAAALVPGGAFLIDVINLLALAGGYRERWWGERDGVLQIDENEFDFLEGRNRARWTFVHPDGSRTELVHSVRTYTPHELAVMLEAAGLAVEAAWGGWDGAELSFKSRRLIFLARKPG